MIPVLRGKFKDSKIIVLHVDKSFPVKEIPALYSTEPAQVQAFLENELAEIDASMIKIIEWRPSMNCYKEEYVKLLSQTVEFIKRNEAEKRTTAVFGRRWVSNFFKNLKIINQAVLYKTADVPVIITGSGPGLETAIPVIKKIQDNCIIIAASSSVMALSKNGISAGIVIATDGGSWALQHIYPLFRTGAGGGFLAANLCAALPSQCGGRPFLLLNDGSLWQNVILHELALPSVIIPQRGTVTASAVELALVLTSGGVFLAGTDLSVKDIRTHVRPYGFDYLFSCSADRFSPIYSKSFFRSALMREGGSMGIYPAWFKNQLALWPKRVFSLGGGSEVFENAVPPEQKNKTTGGLFKPVNVKGNPDQFCERALSALRYAMKNPEYSRKIKNELSPLLFPGKKEVTEKEIETALLETVKNGAVNV
jgi:hypothetical protein